VNHLYATFRGRRILSREGRAYKAKVGLLIKTAQVGTFDGPVSVGVKLYRPRKAGDLDGFLKSLLDSMTGLIYADDSQIVRLFAERFDDKHKPRAEVTVEAIGGGECLSG
jgi:Holliday junction resolvase RusA-like endonuclease